MHIVNLYLPDAEAEALTKLVKRLEPADCARLAGPCANYGAQSEADTMWSAVLHLQGALSSAGRA